MISLDLFGQMSLYRYAGYRVVSVSVTGSSWAGQGQAELVVDGFSQGLVILPTYQVVQTIYPNRMEYIGNSMSSMLLTLRGNNTISSVVVRLAR